MSNETEDRSPRFNRAVLARIVAVLAFICLGTFAVIQSVLTDNTPKDEVASTVEPDSGEISLNKPETLGNTETQPPNLAQTKSSTNDFAKKTPELNTVNPNPKSDLVLKASSPSSFAPKPGTNNQASAKPNIPTPGVQSFPSDTAKAKPPADRFAKVDPPGTVSFPKSNAINQPNPVPQDKNSDDRSSLQKFNASLAATTNKLQDNVRTNLDQQKKAVTDSAGAAQQKLKDNTNSALNALKMEPKSFQGSGFGQPANSFGPPKVTDTKPAGQAQQTSPNQRDTFGAPTAIRPNQPNPTAQKTTPTPGRTVSAADSLAPLRSATSNNSVEPKSFVPQATRPSLRRNAENNPPNQPGGSPSNQFAQNNFNPKPPTGGNTQPGQFGSFQRQETTQPPINKDRSTDPRAPVLTNTAPSNNGFGQPANSGNNPGGFGQPRAISDSRPQAPTQPSSRIPAKSASAPLNSSFGNSRITEPNGTIAGSSSQPVSSSVNRMSPAGIDGASTLTKPTPGNQQLEGSQTPSVKIEKLAPREIQVNQPAEFAINVRNVGQVMANHIVVFDEVPQGCELISTEPQAKQTADGKLQWNLESLAPGQQKTIKLSLRPVQPGEIGSVAQVTFSSLAAMRTRVTKPVLNITHTAPKKVLIGSPVTLDILVENRGDGPARNVLLQEDVPTQLSFQEGFRELEYEIGDLAPGQSRNVRLTLKAANIGKLKNVMQVTAAGGLKANHSVDMEVIAPKLVATAAGPSRRFLKRQATHTFDVENRGTANATNVELTARLPRGLKYISANNRGEYDPAAHAVYWSLAELGPNLPASVELTTMPIDSGDQKIGFDVSADLNQKTSTEKSLLVEHLVDVFFDIDDRIDPIEIGSSTTYQVRLVNQGTIEATNVQLQLDFPQGMKPESVDGNLPNEIRGQTIVFAPITSLRPGDELKFNVTASGLAPGDHKVILQMQTDGRTAGVSKQETTRVYNDR